MNAKKSIFATLVSTFVSSAIVFGDVAPASTAESTDAPLEEEKNSALEIAPGVTLGVILELTGSYAKQGDEESSDINLDTFEIDLSAEVRDGITFEGALLYEEGEDFCVDSAFFDIELPRVEGLTLEAGLVYMPFGKFETAMISDPMTLELGEISAATAGLLYENDFISASAYAFAGEIEDDNDANNAVACLALTPCKSITLGAAFITDIGEAGLVDDVNDVLAEEGAYDSAAGINAFLSLDFDPIAIWAEYLAAADDLTIGDETSKPQTWSVDLAFSATDSLTLAARYEGSKEFRPEEMPENQFGVAAEYACTENVAVAVEYLHGTFKDDVLDDRDMASLRLALSF